MDARAPVLVGLLIAVGFAGCLGGGTGLSASTSAAAATTPTSKASTPTSTSASAAPSTSESPTGPVALLSIFDNGTALSPDGDNYTSAAGRNLTFDGSQSSGNNITYAWKLGDAKATTAVVNHTFAPGLYNISLTVTDAMGANDTANATLNVSKPAVSADGYFSDGAEHPAKWTFGHQIVINAGSPAPEEVVAQNHPLSSGWHVTTKAFADGTSSYASAADGSEYDDNEYTFMVSPVINLTGSAPIALTFKYKGDSEANSYDGLYWSVSSDAGKTWTDLGKQADGKDNFVKDWKDVTADLSKYAGKGIQLRFLFKSDISCSGDTDDPSGNLCGAHHSYSGYWIDDIKVA